VVPDGTVPFTPSVGVTVNALPIDAGLITGAATVCVGQNGVAYSVPEITGATKYTWTYSGSNVTISGSTNSVLLSFASNATSGTLSVTGTNSCGSGNPATKSIVIGTPAITSMTTTPCNGTVFTVTPTDGVNGTVPSGTTYSWLAPTATGGITGGAAGSGAINITGTLTNPTTIPQTATYTVTPVDGSCTGSTFTVTVSLNPISLTATPVDATCNATSTGGVNLTISGGTPGYTFSWTKDPSVTVIGTTQNLSGLTTGTYFVTVTDHNGCTASTSAVIGQPVVLAITSSVTPVACYAGSTGAISLTSVTGGTSPYTYLWNDGSASKDRTGLIVGTYSVKVTDAKGCNQTFSSIVVSQPAAAISISLDSQTNVACSGGSTGAISITVSGGYGTKTYLWSDSNTSEDRTGLAAGTYSVTVTDGNGCTKTASFTITQSGTILQSGTVTNVSCYGGSTGSIDVTASGGTGPYTYKIGSGEYGSAHLFGSLSAGTKTITVKDATECEKPADYIITQPSAALAATPTTTNVGCNGGSSGQISLAVTGGTPMYTYSWMASLGGVVPSGQANNQNLTGLVAGTYSVTITDSKSCTFSLTGETAVVVTEPPAISLPKSITNVTCNGLSDGAIDLSPTGGTPGVSPLYTFVWSTTAITEDISSLPIGTYSVTVTDSKGCTATTSATVTQPAVLSGSIAATNASCNGSATGNSLVLTVSGGNTLGATPYSWSPGGAITKDLSNIAVGTYTVTITDSKGCTATASGTITQPGAFVLTTTSVRPTCPPSTDGSIDLTVTGGTSGYTYHWVGSEGGVIADAQHTLSNPTGLNPGTYTVTVRDSKGCEATTSVTLTYLHPAAAPPGTIIKN